MNRKTSELEGAALNWAVAKCENTRLGFTADVIGGVNYIPSRSWDQGGPIIEREKIDIEWRSIEGCRAKLEWLDEPFHEGFGSTPLVAAMRCYVASKLGEEVDIPDELA